MPGPLWHGSKAGISKNRTWFRGCLPTKEATATTSLDHVSQTPWPAARTHLREASHPQASGPSILISRAPGGGLPAPGARRPASRRRHPTSHSNLDGVSQSICSQNGAARKAAGPAQTGRYGNLGSLRGLFPAPFWPPMPGSTMIEGSRRFRDIYWT